MRFKMIVLAAAVSFTLPAVAQTNDATAAAPAKEKKTCRREAVTGSIISVRAVCHTKSEWTAIDAANGSNANDTLGDSRLRNSNPLRPGS